MTVYLVGAGPGTADLLTMRAARLLATADVVIFDRLVGDEITDMIAPWAQRFDVGKDPNGRSVSQVAINDLLVTCGQLDQTVVRLKGGDPYVFGRGGEEAIALQAHGIDVEVVPGISSAIAGPASAGIPVTHRGVAPGFTVLTGFQASAAKARIDWDAAAKLGTTLVILMGAASATTIRHSLLAGGAPPDTPVAVVSYATTERQTVTRIELEDLGSAPIVNPAVIVVGPAASLDLARFRSSERDSAAPILSPIGPKDTTA